MCDVKRLIAEAAYQLVAPDVCAADELVHFFQGGTDHFGFHCHTLRTEWIYRVSVVQVFGIREVNFKNVSPTRLITQRIHVERIDFVTICLVANPVMYPKAEDNIPLFVIPSVIISCIFVKTSYTCFSCSLT